LARLHGTGAASQVKRFLEVKIREHTDTA